MSEHFLDCYVEPGAEIEVRPASWRREWMDRTPQQHAYRCLPLSHANSHGWEILSGQSVRVRWSGGPLQRDLQVHRLGSDQPSTQVISAFGSGIVTFRLPVLFRTPPGINLWVMGPPNLPRDGAQPLSGIVETDWLIEHGFTMNWMLTRPAQDVIFRQGEPIAFVCPIPRGFVESFQPRMRPMAEEPEIASAYQQAAARRRQFQAEIGAQEVEGRVEPGTDQGHRWQGRYFRGISHTDEPVPEHQSRLNLRPFRKPSG